MNREKNALYRTWTVKVNNAEGFFNQFEVEWVKIAIDFKYLLPIHLKDEEMARHSRTFTYSKHFNSSIYC